MYNQKEDLIEFDYNSPDEIRTILNRFLKSGKFF